MTDIEGFLTIYGHSDNLLNNNPSYHALVTCGLKKVKDISKKLDFVRECRVKCFLHTTGLASAQGQCYAADNKVSIAQLGEQFPRRCGHHIP